MKSLLFVLNPREIPEALQSINLLDIDKMYFRGFTEKELEPVFDAVIAEGGYDIYLIVSDDAVVNGKALESVLQAQVFYPVVTGYSSIKPKDIRLNVTKTPLLIEEPWKLPYTYWRMWELKFIAERIFQSYSAGWCLTGMWAEYWAKYPFRAYSCPVSLAPQFQKLTGLHRSIDKGMCSDYHVSWRLQKDGVKIMVPKEGYIYHLARHARFNIGKIHPEVVFNRNGSKVKWGESL